MELVAQDRDHLLARFLSCVTSALLDFAGGRCLWQLRSLQQQLPHLLKCVLHFCAGRSGIQVLREFPEALAFPLIGSFDQAQKTHLILYRAMVETAYHHIWLVIRNFSIELEEVSNPLSHFSDSKGRIRKPCLTLRSACGAQFSVSRLHQDFPQLLLRRFIHPLGKQLLPLSLLFSSEGTC